MSATPSEPQPAPAKRGRAKHQPRNQGKTDSFSNPGRDQYQIGPGLFPTGDPPLVKKTEVVFNMPKAVSHLTDMILEMTSSVNFVKFLSRQAHTPQERDLYLANYSRTLLAACSVALIQNYCHSHMAVHNHIGDVSAIINIDQMLPIIARKYALQFGQFANDHVKEAYVTKASDYVDTIRRMVNVAAITLQGANEAQIATQYYSPTHADDHSLDLILKIGYQNIVSAHPLAANMKGYEVEPFQNQADDFVTALNAVQAFGPADRAAMAFYQGNRPANAPAYNGDFWHLISAATGIPSAGLGVGQPAFGNLGAYKTTVGTIAAEYSLFEPLTTECFVVLGNEHHKGMSGSPMQACTHNTLGEVIVVHQPCPMTPTEVAFAAIMPTPFYTIGDLPRTRHNATTADVARVRREFIARAFKP